MSCCSAAGAPLGLVAGPWQRNHRGVSRWIDRLKISSRRSRWAHPARARDLARAGEAQRELAGRNVQPHCYGRVVEHINVGVPEFQRVWPGSLANNTRGTAWQGRKAFHGRNGRAPAMVQHRALSCEKGCSRPDATNIPAEMTVNNRGEVTMSKGTMSGALSALFAASVCALSGTAHGAGCGQETGEVSVSADSRSVGRSSPVRGTAALQTQAPLGFGGGSARRASWGQR